jgi:DNA invertase Pin-like site-specific DNA recombinase
VKMKRAVLYTRVSTSDQNWETQALDLRRLAEQRGFDIVHEYSDRISGAKAKRPALDQMLAAVHRRKVDTVWFVAYRWLAGCGTLWKCWIP